MLPYLTSTVPEPWTSSDIELYAKSGSQRDKVHYNKNLNSRILVLDNNFFLCNVKDINGNYKNIYVCAVSRNQFFFIIYIPQMDAFQDTDVNCNKLVLSLLSNLPLCSEFNNGYKNGGSTIADGVIRISQSCILVQVNANVEQFLFPYSGRFTDQEIIGKYQLVNLLYLRSIKEHSFLVNRIDLLSQEYDRKVKEKMEQQKAMIKRMLIRKGVLFAISAIGVPALLFDALDDFSNLSDFQDIMDASDMADMIGAADIDFDGLELQDLSDGYIADPGNIDMYDYCCPDDVSYITDDVGYNVSFGKKTATFHQEGNLSRTIDLEVEKVEGTSNKWNVIKGGKIIATIQGLVRGKIYIPGFGTGVLG